MRIRIVLLLSMIMVMPAHALQIVQSFDDESIQARISSKETSRITLVGDRIKQYFAAQGRFHVEQDTDKGDLYITPTVAFQDKPISLFITSEAGKTFSLELTPVEQPSETIAIKLSSENKAIAKDWEQGNEYTQSLINLIKAMHQGDVPKGYQLEAVDQEFKGYQVISEYRGNQFKGQVIEVDNNTKETKSLSRYSFASLNPLAIALESASIDLDESTRVFVVTSHE